jgi:hypothetical protein
MVFSRDSREGRVQVAADYVWEARVAWGSVPWDVSTVTATQAVAFAHAVELTVKAGLFYANMTPPADHGCEAMLGRLPLDPAVKAKYEPLVREAASLRAGGAYPGSVGYETITAKMDDLSWRAFRSAGEALTAIVENVGEFLAGEADRPLGWSGPGPSTK